MQIFTFIFAAFPVLALAAIGDTCTHSLGTGTCKLTTSCAGYTVSGACPNDPSNVKCCTIKSCSTSAGTGTCKNTSTACSGTYYSGACPGDSSIQCCVAGSTPPPSGNTGAAVLAAAKTQTGVPYSWGGGNCNGKSLGIEQGANTVGFDCSGLTQYAVCQATGKSVVIPRTTRGQYAVGKRIPLAQRQIGDLIYYATGGDCSCSNGYCAALYHTAIWAGNNQMFEAQKTGTTLGLHTYRTGTDICPYVIRHW
ncbi:hypothetical protein FPQ18DRAFT_133120 [Pyronema domesticum]|uniref:Similar to Peptidoglycan endopeptidase RipB acc. no. O53169 n=1 Tax=Pyronema omphalodes (strain CBS 100304) TaxID=1076935 RepID=U4KX77_PYROM|nr:hypothetical protein FPQ18DRAFT_133120 [Pyronema domesticum]CCX05901.1 Similar to Peptidoglycan endopeptidase RipB; acc. no. O53169 [Pyronema omphalodes CBS 100304]